MATIKKTLEIAAPIERVWERVADLEGVRNLFAMLADASLDGEVRTCRTVDGQQLKELIVSCDPELRRLVYAVVDSPFGFDFHAASWQLEPVAGGTRLTWYTEVKPDGAAAVLEPVIDGELPNIAAGLAA
ncbi:MAG: SRPBCC family protein [Myxococcota bacterium]